MLQRDAFFAASYLSSRETAEPEHIFRCLNYEYDFQHRLSTTTFQYAPISTKQHYAAMTVDVRTVQDTMQLLPYKKTPWGHRFAQKAQDII